MIRVLGIVLAIAAVVAALGVGGGGDERPTYVLEFDQAFGVVDRADVRVAGVRVGQVSELGVDRRTFRALVTVEIDRTDFGELRADTFCRLEPQSLIGEYFVNCDAGTAERRLESGARIPVEQTGTTVQPDLVNNILRRPWRERLGIILTELGAGFGARGEDLQETIRRALPALRETDRVLAILAANRRTLQALTRDADTVLGRLSDNRDDVARFVAEARDTAQASASRRTELAATVRRFPPFLRALRPTLADLGAAARAQTPALRDLRLSAGDLTTLLDRLGPFAQASRPAIRSLGRASQTGTRAARLARPTVAELRNLASRSEAPATNLRHVLEHLDDRRFAVEENPESPGGSGFTGLEALLRYPYVQSQAINVFDTRGYLLKLNALVNECTGYTNAEGARRNPERARRCSAALGPSRPGIDEPVAPRRRRARSAPAAQGAPDRGTRAPRTPATPGGGPGEPGPAGEAPRVPLPDLPEVEIPPIDVPGTGLLDFLLAP